MPYSIQQAGRSLPRQGAEPAAEGRHGHGLSALQGLGLHKETVLAYRVTPDLTEQQIDGLITFKEFGTPTSALLALAGGGRCHACRHGKYG
jgi:hypothetical protein